MFLDQNNPDMRKAWGVFVEDGVETLDADSFKAREYMHT